MMALRSLEVADRAFAFPRVESSRHLFVNCLVVSSVRLGAYGISLVSAIISFRMDLLSHLLSALVPHDILATTALMILLVNEFCVSLSTNFRFRLDTCASVSRRFRAPQMGVFLHLLVIPIASLSAVVSVFFSLTISDLFMTIVSIP